MQRWIYTYSTERIGQLRRNGQTDPDGFEHGRACLLVWATPGMLEAMKPGRMQGHGGTAEVPG